MSLVPIPVEDFEIMQERLEDTHDEAMLKYALDHIEEFFSAEIVKRLIDGEGPTRVYRIHRGMTQQDLAGIIEMTKTTVSEIEAGKK